MSKRNSHKPNKIIEYESDSEYHSCTDDSSVLELNESSVLSINNDSSVIKHNESSVLLVEESESMSSKTVTKAMQIEFKKGERLFKEVLKRRINEGSIPSVKSVEIIRSSILETAYTRQKEAFQMKQISTRELYVYHKCSLPSEDKIELIHHNLKVENATGFTYGRGIYFSEYPDIELGYIGSGLLVCKVMPGNEYLDKSYRLIPDNYHSKRVLASEGREEILIIENSSQILPCYFIKLRESNSNITPGVGIPYNYKVNVPTDNTPGPLEDKANIPRIITVLAENVGSNIQIPEIQDDEEEPICGSTSSNVPVQQAAPATPVSEILNNDRIAKKMRSMFESSLKLQETGQLMMPAEAILTQLYKHQMYALAWMANRENSQNTGIAGGILADDMGLGKTLTILSLVVTNFHDKRPLAKPDCSGAFSRAKNLTSSVLRYMPGQPTNFKRNTRVLKETNGSDSRVGAKLNDNKRKLLASAYENMEPKRRKDNKQKVKSSKNSRYNDSNNSVSQSKKISAFDMLPSPDASEDDEKDEFDSMCFSSASTLSERIFGSNSKSSISLLDKPEQHFYDGLSDDDEYQNMSEKERNERLKPINAKSNDDFNANLNVDGMVDLDSSDDDFVSTTSRNKTNRVNRISSDDEKEQVSVLKNNNHTNSNELPDLENSINSGKVDVPAERGEKSKDHKQNSVFPKSSNGRKSISTLDLNEEQRKKLIIPPRDPPKLHDRRRATLIITPASLLGHWLLQIQQHIDDSVDLKIAVHHGQCRAFLGTELQDNDIVLTTYGTVAAENNSYQLGPLLRAKWLRVILDEGHLIKNHNSQTAKACYQLDTRRKWIVSGTPIQNNLTELWALLKWLEVEPYASHRQLYKRQIEHAVKHGHPNGLQRLQTLIQAICLRRTKSDQVNGKPIVQLPNKSIVTTELEFTEEENTVYRSFESKGREIILRYQRKGTLLSNWAHVFAVMMRLRQLCCHRELLPVQWKDVNMEELEEQVRIEMEAANRSKASNTPEGEERNKVLAEQLRQMIKEGFSDECSICLSEFTQPVITPCAHIYCRGCITVHIEATASNKSMAQCPLCRGNLTIEKLLEAAQCQEDEEMKSSSSNDPFENVRVDVSSTKINAAMRQLEISRLKGSKEKTIIVSQFTTLLSIIQPLLEEKGFSYARLDGSMNVHEKESVISRFQDASDNAPQVLLLSLRAGGVGLNLTAARKLILLDPAWNPATEEQCFDRIHRLGQMEDVEIHKFVMKDSIEQRMLAIQDKKKDLISGAFRQTAGEMRERRIQDILSIFGL